MSKRPSVERIVLDIISEDPKHYYPFEEIKEACPFVSDERLRKALSNLRKDRRISAVRSGTDRRKKEYTLKGPKDRAKAWVRGEYPFDDTKLTHLGGEEGVLGIFHNLGAAIPIINSPQVDRIPYDCEKEYSTSGTTIRKAVITLPFVKENRNHRATLRNFNNKTFTVNFRPFSYRGADRTQEMWNKIVDYVEDLCSFLESEYGYVVGRPNRHAWEVAVENRYLDDIVRRGWYLMGDDHWVDNTPRTKDNHAKEETHDIEKAQRIGKTIETMDSINQTLQEVRDRLKEVRDGQKETGVERQEDREILIQLVRGSLDIANLIAHQTSSQRTFTEIPGLKSYVGEYRKRMRTVKKAKEEEEQRKWVPHDEVVLW